MASTYDDATSLFNFVVRDGHGIKGLVDSGISRVPERYIQPPEERINKSDVTTTYLIPLIDLSNLDGPDHAKTAAEIVHAATNLGFFQVINHGLEMELFEELKRAAFRFFEQEPEKKAMYKIEVSPSPHVKYGTSFVPAKEKSLEWKDFVSMAYTSDHDAHVYWPQPCKEAALEYLKSSMDMARKILRVLIANLKPVVEDSDIDALNGSNTVNMNFYPKCPNPDLTVGVGRHSDLGALTILLQDDIGGLYIKIEEDINVGKKGGWVEIPPISGALVVNIGDILQILSNGRYKSAEHRVRTTSTKSRVSIPLFIIPKFTQKIGPLPELVEKDGVARYKEFVYGDYFKNFVTNVHEGKKSLDFAKAD